MRSIKDILRSPDSENVQVDLDDLFKVNRISPSDRRFSLIKDQESVSETVRLLALTFNEKAMIALTKDKYRLAL